MSTIAKAKTRDLKIDQLKGFLIICVVIGHSLSLLRLPILIEYNFIYFFHMPLFIAVSCFYCKEISLNYFIKRFLLIIAPYLFWRFYPNLTELKFPDLNYFKATIGGNWFYLKSILWFLPMLFSTNIMISIILKIKKNIFEINSINITIVGFWVLIIFLINNLLIKYHSKIPFGIDVAFYLFPLIWVLKVVHLNMKSILDYFKTYQLIIIITAMSIFYYLLEPLKKVNGYFHRLDLAQFNVPIHFYTYFIVVILSSAILIFFYKIKTSSLLVYVGKYTMPIFLLHLSTVYFPFYILTKIGFNIDFSFFDFASKNYMNYRSWVLFFMMFGIVYPIVISKILMKISKKFEYIGMSA